MEVTLRSRKDQYIKTNSIKQWQTEAQVTVISVEKKNTIRTNSTNNDEV